MEGGMYTSVERNFLPEVTREADFEKVRCMAVMRVWRNRPSDGNVELMERKPDRTKVVTLNEAGSYLWSLADDHLTLDEVIDRFAEHYELSREQATDDVLAFLNSMIAKEHIRAVPE